jgi:hypothetical protein
MRVILWLVAALAVLWGGYWYVSAGALRAGTETALATMKAEGRADYSGIDLGGFPARFKLTVTDPQLRDPNGGWTWRAAQVVVHALAYNPGQIIAVLPDDQTLAVGRETIALKTTDLRASMAFGLATALPLSHAEAVSGAIAAQSDLGWSLTGDALRLAIRAEDPATFRYRLGAESSGLTLSGFPAEVLTRAHLTSGPGRVRLDADATFDRALDRTAAEVPPRTTGLDIRSLELDWDRLSLRGSGTLTIGPDGVPDGELSLSLRNWQGLPPLLVAAGVVTPDMERALTRTMAQLAALSGKPDELTLPLNFKAGWVALGPLPLGPAPRF